MGEHIDWALLRADMAAGMGALSAAVYGNSQLPVREREAARWTIALINDCVVCRDTRARDGEAAGAGEPFYAEVTDWRAATGLSRRERLAAEFAERFAIDHLAMDDAHEAAPQGIGMRAGTVREIPEGDEAGETSPEGTAQARTRAGASLLLPATSARWRVSSIGPKVTRRDEEPQFRRGRR